MWLRSAFTIHGRSSHDANAATFPPNPGRPCSHSSTVTFGLGIRCCCRCADRGSRKGSRCSRDKRIASRWSRARRCLSTGRQIPVPVSPRSPSNQGISFSRRSSGVAPPKRPSTRTGIGHSPLLLGEQVAPTCRQTPPATASRPCVTTQHIRRPLATVSVAGEARVPGAKSQRKASEHRKRRVTDAADVS